jgi:hypothetical protein
VPQDQLSAAVKSGGMPAVKFTAPDKSIRFVPANRYQEAAAAGGIVMPLQDQEIKHPGFWSALYNDAKGLMSGSAKTGLHLEEAALGDATDLSQDLSQQGAQIKQNWQTRTAKGEGLPYKVGAAANEALGVNVKGEEESAAQGDLAGVAGHAAAVPAAMAVSAGAARVAPMVVDAAPSVARTVTPGLKIVASRAPEVVGAGVGAYAGHATGIPGAGWAGATIGRDLGAKLADAFSKSPQEFAAELDATAENKPFAGGMDEWTPKPGRPLDATGENKPFAGGMDEPRAIPKRYTPPSEAPVSASPAAPASTPTQAPSVPAPSGDALLDRLRAEARNVAAKPKATESAPEQDLMDLLNESLKPENLKKFRDRKAAATVQ